MLKNIFDDMRICFPEALFFNLNDDSNENGWTIFDVDRKTCYLLSEKTNKEFKKNPNAKRALFGNRIPYEEFKLKALKAIKKHRLKKYCIIGSYVNEQQNILIDGFVAKL